MAYTDQQIKDYALQLEQNGASAEEIEAFVSAAVAERGAAPQAPKTPARPVPAAMPQRGMLQRMLQPPVMDVSGASIRDVGAAADVGKQMAAMGVDAGLEAGGATAGQAAGAAAGPLAPVAMPVLGGLGATGGAYLASKRGGEPMTMGRAASAFIGGMVPGGSMAGASGRKVAAEAGKYAAQNMAAATAESVIDERKVPELSRGLVIGGVGALAAPVAKGLDTGTNPLARAERAEASRQAAKRETLKLGRELGYVLPPSVVRPNPANDFINSVGGKAATLQQAVQRNQPITNAAVRDELGLPADTALTPQALEVAKLGPSKTYGEIGALSPQASIALENFKQAQSEAQAQFFIWRNQIKKDASLLESAKQKRADAEAMLAQLKAETVRAGKPELFDKFNEARVKLAQIGLVERAVNKATGDVDAQILGDAFDAGEKLTGNLEKIGRFANAFKQAVREASESPPSGVHQLLPMMATAAGGAGVATHGPQGLAYAAPFLLAPPAMRQIALSAPYQNAFVNYTAGATRQDVPAMLARFMTQGAGRQEPRPVPYRQ